MPWQQIRPDIWRWPDSCQVYALIGPTGCVVINAGSGAWLAERSALPVPPVAVICTHFFRDHSAGAAAAARAGIAVYAPAGEAAIIADPAEHFRRRDTYLIYDNYWDLFAPIEPTTLAGVVHDYQRLVLGGLTLEIIPLPGVTVNQIGVGYHAPDGMVICCAEALHSAGRLARIAPLQYNYNDLGGAVAAYGSAAALRACAPVLLLPSLGPPLAEGCDAALALLQHHLRLLCAGRPEELAMLGRHDGAALHRVSEHVWMTTQTSSTNWFLVSRTGEVLVIDYGYHETRGVLAPAYSKPYRRRALLHSLQALRDATGSERVAVVLLSHFHDDHVCGVPLLQRLYGTACWAPEPFAALLEQPAAHCFPCDWPEPLRIDRRIALDEVVQWHEFRMHFAAMNGHTRFAALIGFEADGLRFAHTGDQYFFLDADGRWATDLRRWDGKQVMQNHVYRNGALLDGFRLSADWLLRWRPDVVLSGHQPAMWTDEAFFALVARHADEYVALHRMIMPLDDDQPHRDIDSWGGWIWPYRTTLPVARTFAVQVTVRNPLPRAARLTLRLVGPAGWHGEPWHGDAAPRAELSVPLQLTPAGPCVCQPFAVELWIDGQPHGQVAEALVSIGHLDQE